MNVSGLAKATKYELIVVASNGVLEQHSLKEEVITKGGGRNIIIHFLPFMTIVVYSFICYYPSLVLVQPRKTRPCLTERLLMGRKE